MIFMLMILIGIVAFSTTLSSSPVVVLADGQSPYNSLTEYRKGIAGEFTGSILNKSKLTISSTKVEKDIMERFPELDSVRVILPIIGRKPVVTIHARQPVLQYKSQNKILVIDSSGMAVCEVSSLEESARNSLIYVEDLTNVDHNVGDKIMTKEAVAFIDTMKQQLLSKGLNIDKVISPVVANQLDIYIKGSGYYVKTDYTGDARLQSGTYLAIREKFGANKPNEYVDVRVEEKAFYR